MVLEAGSRLGHYEIIELLGAGGMGAVYRARDPRLNREVAIKVLAAAAAGDATLLRRLEQEARTIAGLNHPNLVGIFDIGTHDGAPFLVMELLQGATLREKLAAGPLPLRRAVEVARQVAQGLAAAHAAGVVHRDLKPDNIFITSDGRAKILDFGLAKTTVMEAAADAATMAGEVTHTQPGTVMGTVGYMAPEQVRGETATATSDIFAFGAILYEMFCGRRAFAAASSVETMSAILRDDPPEPLVQGAPLAPELERIVRRCLEKEPQRRFQSAADLDFALAAFDPSSTHLRSGAAAALAGRRRLSGKWLWPAAGLAAGFLLAALWGWPGGEPSLGQATYTPIAPSVDGNAVFWSPDSSALVYAAPPAPGQHDQVFVRYLSAATPVQLTHASGDVQPVGWSDDGASVYFDDADGNVWSVAVVGGAASLAMDWKGTGLDQGVRVVAEHGGAWAALVQPAQKNFGIWTRAPGGAGWTQYKPDPFAAHTIVNQPSLSFSPDGHSLLLYMNSERSRQEAWLLPLPADAAHPPRRVLQELPQQLTNDVLSWLPDSRHVLTALPAAPATAAQLWLADTRGGVRQLTTGLMSYFGPRVSPDGAKIVFARRSGDFDVVSVDLATAAVTPLLSDSRNEDMPAWALHQPVMVYSSDRNGPRELWLHTQGAGGGVSERPIPLPHGGAEAAANGFLSPALSPNADRVLYDPLAAGGSNFRLLIASVAGGRPVRVTNDSQPRLELNGSWSPDGNTIAYYAVSGDHGDLMSAPATGNAAPVRLRADVGPMVPVWTPDGSGIVCQTSDKTLHLISADGKRDRALGKFDTAAVAFSPDGKLLYGIEVSPQHVYLEAMEAAGGAVRRVGELGSEYAPNSSFNPGYRFTLTPDGKHLSYSTGRFSESLYLMQHFSLQTTGWARVREMLHIPQP